MTTRLPPLSLAWTHPATGAGLWIGGDEFDAEMLAERGIDTVLSLADAPRLRPGSQPRMRRLLFADGPLVPDADAEREAVAFVRAALAGGRNVLVHCSGGLNRSPYLAARILVAEGLPPAAAVRQLLARRHPLCLSNETFARAILGHPVPPAWREQAPRR